MNRQTVELTNRDLYGAQAGLAVLAAARAGKCELFGTFKFHLSVIRRAVDDALEQLAVARRDLRDQHAKRDGRDQIMTVQVRPDDPNATQVLLKDPIQFEADERQALDERITLAVPLLRIDDVTALDFTDVRGDYSGALIFVVHADEETAHDYRPPTADRDAPLLPPRKRKR